MSGKLPTASLLIPCACLHGVPDAFVDQVQTELRFKSKFAKRLIRETEYGTLRAGRRVPAAETLPVVSTETGRTLGRATIMEVRWLSLKEALSSDLLRFEYTNDSRQLRKDLTTIYPRLTDDSWVTFFRFKFVQRTVRRRDIGRSG